MQINTHGIYTILFIAFLLTLFHVSSVKAQSRSYPFKQLALPQDLPDIFCMYEDHKGFIWLGTVEGLYQYDGIHFTYYSGKKDFGSLGREHITYIIEDHAQNLWIGARSGMYRYKADAKDFEKFAFADEVYPYYIHEETDSTFIIHTIHGIYIFNPKNNRWNKLDTGIKDPAIFALYRGNQDDLWIGTEHVVRKYDLKNHTSRDFPLIIPEKISRGQKMSVNALFLDSRNQLWINTWFKGIIKLDTESGKSEYFGTASFNAHTYLLAEFNSSIIEDIEGNVWLSSYEKGLNIYNPGSETITHIEKGEDFGFGLIGHNLGLMTDRAKNIWVKSDRALHYLSRSSAVPQMVTDKKWFLDDAIIMHFLTPDWILQGTFFGLNAIHLTSGSVTSLNKAIELPLIRNAETQAISDILKSDHQTMWLASPDGLRKMNYSIQQDGSPAFRYQYLCKTKPGFWPSRFIPVNDSIVIVRGRTNTTTFAAFNMNNCHIEYHHTIDSMLINQVAFLQGDTILCCIRNRGLYAYDLSESSWTPIPWKFEDSHTTITKPVFLDIVKLQNGQYAISTENYGVILYDPPRHRFDLIPTGTLANSNIVFDVAEDAHHNLWIQTSNQLLHFETNTGTLSKSNLSNSFKGQHPGYFMHEGKELYATFEGSLFKIPLDQLIAKDEKLKLYLREIKTREEPLEWENKLRVRLPYSDNFLSYGFVAIDYENPQGVRYWYRIPEINNDWISIDKNTSVNFGRLSPGTYHFSVRAANSAGWVSEEVQAPPIHITPPFWRSWWFIALVILISTTLMGYLLWLKRMKTEAEMRLRNKIAKDLHDDIGSTLSGIRIFSGIAADMATGHEELSPILRKISDKSDTMMQSMSDIVWSVNPVYDSLHDMMIRLKQYMSEVLESQNIDVHVQSHVDLKNIKLGLQQRKEIYLALKEIIHNAAKHAQCQVLNFDISRQKNELVFRIQDDGIGIDESNLVYGNGLRNIQERIQGIGGHVLRESSPGKGMSYEIRIRIGK